MSTKKIALIAEGHGEVHALPKLVVRLLQEKYERYDIFPDKEAKNAKGRGNLTKANGVENFIRVCNPKDYVGILIVIDTEGECPKTIAQDFYQRIMKLGVAISVVIVCANCEYETWFLPNVETLVEQDILTEKALIEEEKISNLDIEKRVGVKGWLTRHMPAESPYSETFHQPIMTRYIDIEQTSNHSRSFRRLEHAIAELLHAIDSSTITITPSF